MAKAVGAPFGNIGLCAVGMCAGDGDRAAISQRVYSFAGHLPGALGAIVKRNGHIAAVNSMYNTIAALQQISQQAAFHIGKRMRAVDGDAFVVTDAGHFKVLVGNINLSANIFPVHARSHGNHHAAGTAAQAAAIAAVVGNGDFLCAV